MEKAAVVHSKQGTGLTICRTIFPNWLAAGIMCHLAAFLLLGSKVHGEEKSMHCQAKQGPDPALIEISGNSAIDFHWRRTRPQMNKYSLAET